MSQRKLPRNDLFRTVAAMLDIAGVPHTWRRGGKHWRLNFTIEGQARTMTLPGTPSCSRSQANVIADLRRFLRQGETPKHRKDELTNG